MVDTIVIIAGVVVGAGVLIAVVSWWMSRSYSETLYQSSITKGMNGLSGDTIQLACPLGQVIAFPNDNPTTTRGAIFCPGMSTCDAFFNPSKGQATSFFSPNIVDVLGNLSSFPALSACAGQQSCSFTVPSASDLTIGPACVKGCKNSLAFVGTYNCVAG